MRPHTGAGRKSGVRHVWAETRSCFDKAAVFSLPYLSRGGLSAVEVITVWRVRGAETWLEEHAAERDRFNGSGALVGEAKTDKHLRGKKRLHVI